nr:2026_t:CDS:2 [Entrophospora candida]
MSISSILNSISSDRIDNESSSNIISSSKLSGNDNIYNSAIVSSSENSSIIINSLDNSFNIGNSSTSGFDNINNSNEYLMEIDNLIRRKDGKIPFLDMAFNLIFKKRRKKPAIIQIDNLATSKNVHNDENCDRIDQTDNNIKYTAEDIFYGSDLTEIEESTKKSRGRKRSFPKNAKTKLNESAQSSSSPPIIKQKRKYNKEHPNLTITTATTAATTTVIPLPTTPDMPDTIATSTSSQSGGKKSIFKCRVFGCEKVFSSSSNRSRHQRLKHLEDDIDDEDKDDSNNSDNNNDNDNDYKDDNNNKNKKNKKNKKKKSKNNKTYKCSECGKNFAIISTLNHHKHLRKV